MNNPLAIDLRTVRRIACAMLATLMVVAVVPWFAGHAGAVSYQLSQRSIQMSDSARSGTSITSGVGSGTNVTYKFTFTPVTVNVASFVIDFCYDSPILADACDQSNMSVGGILNANTATLANIAGTVGGTGWSATASPGHIALSDTNSGQDAVAGTQQIFTIGGIKNPDGNAKSFYARITGYADNAFGAGTPYNDPQTLGNYNVYGGIALATTTTITVTARVQETLSFCVTKADPATWSAPHDCTATEVGGNPPAVILGHGSGTRVLDSSQVDGDDIWSQLSTNATNGAVINLRNSNTTCGGLSADGGSTCALPPIGTVAPCDDTAACAITAGAAAFGLFVGPSQHDAASPASTGTITPSAKYYNASHVCDLTTTTADVCWYGMDTTTATGAGTIPSTYTGGVTGTYGSTIASTTAPVYRVENRYIFGATASLTTPAGLYTANLSMIATGTF